MPELPAPAQNVPKIVSLFQGATGTSNQAGNFDRTIYEVPQPQNPNALADLMKNHPAGENFPYIGVVGSAEETSDARRSRLLALKPSHNKRDIPEIVIGNCALVNKDGFFTMKSLIEHAKRLSTSQPVSRGALQPQSAALPDYHVSKPYVHVKQMTVLYTPNVSSTSNYCNLWFKLEDSRLIDPDKGSQTNIVASNQESVTELSCDYCVTVQDLEAFKVSYNLERDVVVPGYQWGTASFYFLIVESDLPYQTNKKDAIGVYRMPRTTLTKRVVNADLLDMSFVPNDIATIREMYEEGAIIDVEQPEVARLKTNTYVGTQVRRKSKGKELEAASRPGWEHLKGKRVGKVNADEVSEDPEDGDESEVSAGPSRFVPPSRSRVEEANKRWIEEQAEAQESPKSKTTAKGSNGNDLERYFSGEETPPSKKQVRLSAADV